jgi:hypothetical protein
MYLLLIPIGLAVLWITTSGQAFTASQQSKAHTSWLSSVLKIGVLPIVFITQQAVQLTKWIAAELFPAFKYAEKAMAGWLGAMGLVNGYSDGQQYRMTQAMHNTASWANITLRGEIGKKAAHDAKATSLSYLKGTVAPPPIKRVTQREIDIEFQKLIESNFVKQLEEHDPRFKWDKDKWLKYLGLLPALGDVVVHPKPTHPQPQHQPQPVAPPQKTTLPHTDDKPNPEPGTQVVPGVISAKDKWARGQIVNLKKRNRSLIDRLGPLAFLAITIPALTTLIGLLECKNFGRFARGICHVPTNLFNDLMALLFDTLILADICEVIDLVESGFGVVEGPLTDFIGGVGGALCHGDFKAPPAMVVPQLHLWDSSQIAA